MEEKKNSVYLTGIPYTCVEEDIIEFFKSCGAPTRIFLPKFQDSGRSRGFAHVEFSSPEEMQKAIELNGKHIKERYITIVPSRGVQPKVDKPIEEIPEHCKTIFVKGLPYKASENEVGDIFKECGGIKEVRLVKNWKTNEFKGFAYIEFNHSKAVKNAVKLNGMVFDGRNLKVVIV